MFLLAPLTLAPWREAGAQTRDELSAEQRRQLETASLAAARTALLDAIEALPLAEGRKLADWFRKDVALDRAMRRWVRELPRAGGVRLYADGVCEADVRVEPVVLRDQLLRLMAAHPEAAAGLVDEAGLKQAARGWTTVWATGRASRSRERAASTAPGWEDVSFEAMEQARAAATADAFADLMARAERLKVTNARRLREFLDSSADVRAAVAEALRRNAGTTAAFEPDQIAVVEVRLALRELLRILTRVHADLYRGDAFEAADFREMALLAEVDTLVGRGMATPPREPRGRTGYEPIEFNAPDWIDQAVRAVGRYLPAEDEAADEDVQAEAARLDAILALQRKIDALIIQQRVTVREFVGYHRDLKDDVVLYLSGARPLGRPIRMPDGAIEVHVELPLKRLWEIVRRRMILEEVDPPAGTPG